MTGLRSVTSDQHSQCERARTIAVVTGSRAEFGLLRPVMRAVANHEALNLHVIVTGAHLLPPAVTADEVAREFDVAARVGMQRPHECARLSEASAVGRGVAGLAEHFAERCPDIVLVLGDRIEAFAAAVAAAISGILVAHMHGGDRAEGLVDESLRHAISKLAHLHLPATETSAHRLIAMGEEPQRVHVVGSPAMDDVAAAPPLPDCEYEQLGSPEIVFLVHPTGDEESVERDRAARLLELCQRSGRTLALHPNHDPGRSGIMRAIEESECRSLAHLPREQFLGLLRRARVLIGNSSAGLIEAAAVPMWCINVGRRQSGRERAGNVIDVEDWNYQTIDQSLRSALNERIGCLQHPYGDGRTGERVANLLASLPLESLPLRKRNTY